MVGQNVKGVLICRNVMCVLNLFKGRALACVALGAAILLAGCQREQVSTYEVPKEDYAIKTPSRAGSAQASARPQVNGTPPKGWVERPGQMGLPAYRVQGEEGKHADVRIIPLKAGEEIEKQSVNIWRDELGLPELPTDQIHGEEFELA